MTTPFEAMAGLDRLIHEPARLAILTALSAAQSVDFLFLQRLTGLTKGNLSTHLSKLEEAELVKIDKHFEGKKPITTIYLTTKGKTAINNHWQQLEQLRDNVREWEQQQKASE